MAQKWYQKTGVQTSIVTGIFLVTSTILAGIFGLFQSKHSSETSLDNQVIQDEVLRNLPENSRADFDPQQYYQEYKGQTIEVRERRGSEGYFRILPLPETVKSGTTIYIGLFFYAGFDLSKAEVLYVSIEENRKGERFTRQLKNIHYKIHGRLNKLPVIIDIPSGEYILSIGFISSEIEKKVVV